MDIAELEAIPEQTIIPYASDYQLYVALYISVQSFAATFILVFVLMKSVSQLISLGRRPSSIFVISLCVGDLLNCLHLMVLGFSNYSYGGWILGYKWCIASSLVHLTCSAVSLLSALSITLERYLVIVHKRTLILSECLLITAFKWIVAIICATYMLMANSADHGFFLKSGMAYCSLAWHIGAGYPKVRFEVFCIFIGIFLVISFIVFANWKILQIVKVMSLFSVAPSPAVRQSPFKNGMLLNGAMEPADYADWIGPRGSNSSNNRSIFNNNNNNLIMKALRGGGIATGGTNSFATNPGRDSTSSRREQRALELANRERILNLKAAFIISTFIIAWTPYFVLIFVSMVTNEPASPTFDSTCSLLLTLQVIVDPLVIVAFDSRFRVFTDLRDT